MFNHISKDVNALEGSPATRTAPFSKAANVSLGHTYKARCPSGSEGPALLLLSSVPLSWLV